MPPLTADAVRQARVAASVYRQMRELRRALRSGETLGALAAAARIHAVAVRPNLRLGDWARAQACCERLLACLPDQHAPGYQPGLRRVVECLHADAARAAREGGDLDQAKVHLITRLGYLRDRRAPVSQQARALIDLAHVYIATGETFTGGRMLADVGLLLTTEYPRPEEDDDGNGIAGLLAGPRFERPGPAPRVLTAGATAPAAG